MTHSLDSLDDQSDLSGGPLDGRRGEGISLVLPSPVMVQTATVRTSFSPPVPQVAQAGAHDVIPGRGTGSVPIPFFSQGHCCLRSATLVLYLCFTILAAFTGFEEAQLTGRLLLPSQTFSLPPSYPFVRWREMSSGDPKIP